MFKLMAVLHCLLLMFLVWRLWNCKSALLFIGYALIAVTQITALFLIVKGQP